MAKKAKKKTEHRQPSGTQATTDFQQPRKRTRKLTPQQMQRWLEKEADNSRIYNLTLDVNDLKHQVQLYETQRRALGTRLLVARGNFDGAAVRTVDQFFRIYARGHREWRSEESDFLVASTHEEVAISSTTFGREPLFEQWERYTKIFSMRSFLNLSMVTVASDPAFTIVKCVGEFSGYVSMTTIDVVFQQIRSDEALVQRVLGCRIRVPANTHVYFDRSGRIVRFYANADVFAGLNDLLVSRPRDAITMMASARINTASMIPGTTSASESQSPDRRDEAQGPFLPPIHDASIEADNVAATAAASAREEGGSRHSIEYILS